MDPDESESTRNRRKIILQNKFNRKTSKLTGRNSCVFLCFCNVEFKFIIDDCISPGTSDKNYNEQSSQTSTISFGEADYVLRTCIVYDCCLLFTTNVLQ